MKLILQILILVLILMLAGDTPISGTGWGGSRRPSPYLTKGSSKNQGVCLWLMKNWQKTESVTSKNESLKKSRLMRKQKKSFWNMPKISIFPNGLNQS
ncbi:hypothetical protein ACSAWF_07430 [Neisseria gonorrhoeae]|uniref:hypothetical protein n=1 Tax=Neisseria gonorrhoeae TaxID=485 RepID=UPI003ABACA06